MRRVIGAKKVTIGNTLLLTIEYVSGTGKKTTARHMGKMFYDMGFVSTKDVVECSATDLIGQYVGHTAPKTRKKLQDSLGRVLSISESGRLMNSSFASEAVEELLQFLSNPFNIGKIVVVLTGLTADVNKLLAQYPTLSGLFSEEMIFEALSPDDCIKTLSRELKNSGILINIDALTDKSSDGYCQVRQLFRTLGAQSGWSNTRDVKNLAKQIIRRCIHNSHLADMQSGLSIVYSVVTESMDQMIAQRRVRPRVSDPDRRSNDPALEVQQQATAPPRFKTDIYRHMSDTINNKVSPDVTSAPQQNSAENKAFSPVSSIVSQKAESSAANEGRMRKLLGMEKDTIREEGVSDEDWQKFSEKKKEQNFRRQLREMKVQTLKRQIASFEEKEDEENIKKYQERLSEAQKNILEEEKIQKSLREMGRCEAGFTWIREGDGYRCEGGSHYISDKELSEKS